MKKLTTIWLLMLVSATLVLAQTSDEKELLKFIADYDQAYVNQDISFAERNWADDYVISTETGSKGNRADSLEFLRKDKADPNPKYKLMSFKSVNDTMHISGNTAMVSGTYTSSIVPTDDLKSEPHIDTGRYTMVLEKRNGKWMVIAEHFSEAPHDKKKMEAEVMKAGQSYGELLKRKDRAALERLFHDDYMFTDDDGTTRNKAEDINMMVRPDLMIESEELIDQKVRTVGNNGAVETGIYKVKGTSKGKPFEETGRYTTTWVASNGQWKILADHTSVIKK
ncbi:MAG: nuclear transport factor 2 family protein [Pyrinomonadaceae bacterium]